MTIDVGPVQLVVYGFDRPKFGGGIAEELNRLKEKDIIRVLDALVVHKNAEGDVRSIQVSDLTPEQMGQFAGALGGLIGLGMEGQQGVEPGAEAAIERVANQGDHIFNPEEWDVLEDIPNDSAAALILLEHRWAIPLRDAILGEGGAAIGDIWLHPRDLVAAGLIAADAMAELSPQRS